MLTPHHSSFSHSDPFQKKTPIYIRVYVSLSLSLSYAGARTFIRGVQKNLGPGERAQKGGPPETGGAQGGPRKPVCRPFPHGYPPWEPPGGEKRLYGPLRAKGVSIERPGRRGENREGGATPAEEGRKRTGICPGRPQEARVQALPPWTLPGEPPEGEKQPYGALREKMGE